MSADLAEALARKMYAAGIAALEHNGVGLATLLPYAEALIQAEKALAGCDCSLACDPSRGGHSWDCRIAVCERLRAVIGEP